MCRLRNNYNLTVYRISPSMHQYQGKVPVVQKIGQFNDSTIHCNYIYCVQNMKTYKNPKLPGLASQYFLDSNIVTPQME